MITWDENVKMDPEMGSNLKTIKRRLRWHKKTSCATYCLALATNKDNLLDIYNMGELLFKYYQNSDVDIHIVGLAHNKDAAIDLAGEIVSGIYSETGGFDVRGYYGC